MAFLHLSNSFDCRRSSRLGNRNRNRNNISATTSRRVWGWPERAGTSGWSFEIFVKNRKACQLSADNCKLELQAEAGEPWAHLLANQKGAPRSGAKLSKTISCIVHSAHLFAGLARAATRTWLCMFVCSSVWLPSSNTDHSPIRFANFGVRKSAAKCLTIFELLSLAPPRALGEGSSE